MNEYTEKNLAFFQKKDSDFKFTPEKTGDNLEAISAKNGSPTLRYRFSGRRIFLHSFYNPEEEAKNMVKQFKNPRLDQLVIFGLGMGYHLQALLELNPQIEKIIIVEANREIFSLAIDKIDFEQIIGDRELKIIVGGDLENFKNQFQQAWQQMSPKDYLLFEHLPSRKIFSEFFTAAKEFFMAYHVNLSGDLDLMFEKRKNQQHNTLTNARRMAVSRKTDQLEGKFPGFHACMVYGDVCQNKLDVISSCKDKALILADISSASALFEANIVPDIIFNMSSEDFSISPENAKKAAKSSYMIFTPWASPQTMVEYHNTPKFLLESTDNTLAWLIGAGLDVEPKQQNCKHPVPTMFELLLKMGVTTIMFACKLQNEEADFASGEIKEQMLKTDLRLSQVSDNHTAYLHNIDIKTKEELLLTFRPEPQEIYPVLSTAYKAGKRNVSESSFMSSFDKQHDGLKKFYQVIKRAWDFYNDLDQKLSRPETKLLEECHAQSVHIERIKFEVLANPALLDFLEPSMHPAALMQAQNSEALKDIVDDEQRVNRIIKNDMNLYGQIFSAAKSVLETCDQLVQQYPASKKLKR